MWVALLARLGIEDGLKRFIPEVESNRVSTLINTSVIISIVSSIPVVSISFIILHFFVKDYPSWVWTFPVIILLILNIIGVNINTLFDSSVIGAGKSRMTIWRVLANGVAKVSLLPFFFGLITTGILLAIDIALWFPIILFWILVIPRIIKKYSFRAKPALRPYPSFYRYSFKHFIYNILVNSPTAFFAIIVLSMKSKSN